MPQDQLLRTVFGTQIQDNIFPANEFYVESLDDSGWVRDGKTVVLPQAGGVQTVIKNPTEFPLKTARRVDDALTYTLDKFALEPIHLEDESLDNLLVSYDKRASILMEQQLNLDNRIAENFIDAWAGGIASANKVRTSGADGDSLAPGATGTRKKVVKLDFLKLATMLDKQDVPDDGNRFALISPELHQELLDIDNFVDYQRRGLTDLLGKGFIGELCGIKIKKRSKGAVFTSGAAYKTYGTAAAAGDNLSIIAWHKNFVRRAKGEVIVYVNTAQAAYLGSLMNAAVRAGGSLARTDAKGIVALVQQS